MAVIPPESIGVRAVEPLDIDFVYRLALLHQWSFRWALGRSLVVPETFARFAWSGTSARWVVVDDDDESIGLVVIHGSDGSGDSYKADVLLRSVALYARWLQPISQWLIGYVSEHEPVRKLYFELPHSLATSGVNWAELGCEEEYVFPEFYFLNGQPEDMVVMGASLR